MGPFLHVLTLTPGTVAGTLNIPPALAELTHESAQPTISKASKQNVDYARW